MNYLMRQKRSKQGKLHAYSDRIQNEMIKESVDILVTGFLKLFNIILKTGIFPTSFPNQRQFSNQVIVQIQITIGEFVFQAV